MAAAGLVRDSIFPSMKSCFKVLRLLILRYLWLGVTLTLYGIYDLKVRKLKILKTRKHIVKHHFSVERK